MEAIDKIVHSPSTQQSQTQNTKNCSGGIRVALLQGTTQEELEAIT